MEDERETGKRSSRLRELVMSKMLTQEKLKPELYELEEVDNGFAVPPAPFSQPQLTPQQLTFLRKEVILPVSGIVPGTSAATAANYGTFFVSDGSYEVLAISEEHRTAGNDAGTVTISVEKCESAEAEGAGDDLLSTALSLKATAATPQFGTLVMTPGLRILKKGDRLVLKDAGTLTTVAHVCVTVILRKL